MILTGEFAVIQIN